MDNYISFINGCVFFSCFRVDCRRVTRVTPPFLLRFLEAEKTHQQKYGKHSETYGNFHEMSTPPKKNKNLKDDSISIKMRNSPHSILPFLQHVPVPEVPEPVSGDGPPGGPAGHLGARGHRGGAAQGCGSDPRDGGGRGLDAMGPLGPWGDGKMGG